MSEMYKNDVTPREEEPFEVQINNKVPGRGIMLFNRSRKSDKSPNYRGYVSLLNGEIVRLGMWEKIAKTGQRFYTLSVDTFVEAPKSEEKPAEKKPRELDTFGMDSDIPW